MARCCSWLFLSSIIVLSCVLSSVRASTPDESTDESGQTLNGFLNKAAHSLVYKSMAVILLSHLDTDEQEESFATSLDHPIGDQIGKILKTVGLTLIVAFAVNFFVVSTMICCGFCCCRNASGIREIFSNCSSSSITNLKNKI